MLKTSARALRLLAMLQVRREWSGQELSQRLEVDVARSISTFPYRYRVRVRVHGALADIRNRIPHWLGVLEPLDAEQCILTTGGETLEMAAAMVVHAGVDFTLLEPQELAQPIRDVAARLLRGVPDVSSSR